MVFMKKGIGGEHRPYPATPPHDTMYGATATADTTVDAHSGAVRHHEFFSSLFKTARKAC